MDGVIDSDENEGDGKEREIEDEKESDGYVLGVGGHVGMLRET